MNKQYIGARYVPLVDGTWSRNKSYEPLTVVTYLNSSYTSKKVVPAGVEPTNEEYWALTGNYNGQVEEYRQSVVELSNEIDSFKTNKIVVIGDSYGVATDYGTGMVTPYPTLLKQYLHYTDEQFITAHRSGAGFGNGYFLDLLNSLDNDDEVDELYVFGGWNDIDSRYSATTVNNNMREFSTVCREKFPNAKLYLGMLAYGYELSDESLARLEIINSTTYGQCVRYGFDAFLNTFGVCVQQNLSFWANPETEQGKFHPSTIGSTFIAIRLASVIKTKSVSFEYRVSSQPVALNGLTLGTFAMLQYSDGISVSTLLPMQVIVRKEDGFNINSQFGGDGLEICTFDTTISNGYANLTKFRGVARYHTTEVTDNWIEKDVVVKYSNRKLVLYSASNDISDITEMYIELTGVVTLPASVA